jgi:hypothetical protein
MRPAMGRPKVYRFLEDHSVDYFQYDDLPEPEPAPDDQKGNKGKGKKGAGKRILATIALRFCLEQKDFTLQDVKERLKEYGIEYRVTNSIGTALGRGVGGVGGLRLWRTLAGDFSACRQNAILCICAMSKPYCHAVAQQLGFQDSLDLQKKALALPALDTAALVPPVADKST